MRNPLVLVLATIATCFAGSGTARADGRISSGAQEPLTISFDLPSGDSAQRTLNAAGEAVASETVPTGTLATQAVVISNAAGAVVGKGTVADNKSYVAMPSGNGSYRLVESGVITAKSGKLAGVIVVSSLPGSYAVDLFGTNGKYGVKAVKIGASFELKSATMLASGGAEDRYKVVIHGPDGTAVTGKNLAYPGDCLLVHQAGDGSVTVSNVGTIAAPAAPNTNTSTKSAKTKPAR